MSRSPAAPGLQLRKALGPGILLAGAAIGGSHLVASTQAGARYGWSLVTLLVLVNLFKYPFFLYGQRYTAATGESILHGFRRLGLLYLVAFFGLSLVNAFLSITGVAMITASLSLNLGAQALGMPLAELTFLVTLVCAAIIVFGHYRALDTITKLIVLALAISTIAAVMAAAAQPVPQAPGFLGESPWNMASLGFLILFMGWMPAPIDVAVWPSLWMLARQKQTNHRATMTEVMIDFHIGYLGTVVLAVFFVALGALVIYGSGREFSMASAAFSAQLIQLYTESIGPWAYWLIAVSAFSTMFSTTLTCVDGWPRTLAACTALIEGREEPQRLRRAQLLWIALIVAATYVVAKFFLQGLGQMLEVAMVISFLFSPVFAYVMFEAMRAPWVDARYRPGPALQIVSWAGMAFFIGFTALFLWWFFVLGG